eukprot:1609758-Rhodomonas_salina.1
MCIRDSSPSLHLPPSLSLPSSPSPHLPPSRPSSSAHLPHGAAHALAQARRHPLQLDQVWSRPSVSSRHVTPPPGHVPPRSGHVPPPRSRPSAPTSRGREEREEEREGGGRRSETGEFDALLDAGVRGHALPHPPSP